MKFLLLAGLLFELPWMNAAEPGALYKSEPGKVYVYEAYFNNCPYCHENAPLIEELHKEFLGDDRVVFLDVGRDCRQADYRSWISRHQPDHAVLMDCGGREVISKLGVSAFPTTVIHDCRGEQVFRNVGTLSRRAISQAHEAISEALSGCN